MLGDWRNLEKKGNMTKNGYRNLPRVTSEKTATFPKISFPFGFAHFTLNFFGKYFSFATCGDFFLRILQFL